MCERAVAPSNGNKLATIKSCSMIILDIETPAWSIMDGKVRSVLTVVPGEAAGCFCYILLEKWVLPIA
jgi:hypothetical protein